MLARTLLVAVVFALATGEAQAATVVVPPGNSTTLIAAINTANATGGADTLEVSGTYNFGTADNFWYGPNALPAITSDITIAGDATSGAVIASTNGLRLRLFYVAANRSGLSAGTLRLRDVELRNGRARGGDATFGGGGAGLGGAIYNEGTLDVSGVTFAGNQATGGNAAGVNSTGGGGMGQDAISPADGGGFGGAIPGANAGTGGAGGAAAGGGGGGGGYGAADNGANGGSPAGGAGGGTANGLGGASAAGTRGGNGSGAGGTAIAGATAGGAGGAFGAGGAGGPSVPATNRGGGGGGGVGGGGGGAGPGQGGGGGGFGGGGGWGNLDGGSGGFGGGGAGVDGRAGVSTPGVGGFGGGDGAPFVANSVGVGGGGGGMGGAIFNDRGTTTIVNSTFSGNGVTGGLSTTAFIGGTANAGEGGDAYGAAIFNLNGALTLTHVTIAGNTTTAGTGATNGAAAGAVATVGYDSAGAVTASTTVRQSIVAAATPLFNASPVTVADGATNLANFASSVNNGAFISSTAGAELAALGSYGGPTRTMPLVPGSAAIDAATVQNLAATDQRGFARTAPLDVGAVETQPTTVTADDLTVPFPDVNRNTTLTATVAPGRGATTPGSMTFTLSGGLGPATGAIAGTGASGTFTLPANTTHGDYTITATAPASPGFAGGSDTATLTIQAAVPACNAVSETTGAGKGRAVTLDCTSAVPQTLAIVAGPAHGTLSAINAGEVTYTSADDYAGADTFTYRSTNASGNSNTATVTLDVKARPTLTATRSHAQVNGRYDPQPGSTIEFRVYDNATCTGTPVFHDAVEPSAGGVADTTFAPTAPGDYGWQAEYSGDANNLGGTSACEPQHVASPPPPPPPPPPVTPARVCGPALALLDVSPVGARARVSGVAQPALAGKTVTILRGGKAVGTATIGADGAFAATVAGPAAGDPRGVKYVVTAGTDRSRALRYQRRLRITRRSGLRVAGRLDVERPPTRVTIYRKNACGKQRAAGRVKVSRSGRFSFAMRRPDAGNPYALYRVSARLPKGQTYSTQVAVTP